MKKISIILLFALLLLSSLSFAESDQVALLATITPAYTVGGSGTTCSTCDVHEEWEGASLPSGWNEENPTYATWTFQYATAPAPLRGSYSVRISSITAPVSLYKTVNGGAGLTYYAFTRFNYSANPSGNATIINLVNSGGFGCYLQITTTGKMYFASGPQNWTSTGALTPGTTYFVWMTYYCGTGSNGTATMVLGTSATQPTTANGETAPSFTGLTSPYVIDTIKIGSYVGANMIFDQTYGDVNPIGSVVQ